MIKTTKDEPIDESLASELEITLAYMYQQGAGVRAIYLRNVQSVTGFSTLLKREYVIEDDEGRFKLTDRGIIRGAHEAMKGQLHAD